MTRSTVILTDPRASSPNYDRSLLRALRERGADARLFTADFYPESFEPASSVPGRRYFFLRNARALRRRFRGNRLLTKLAILGILFARQSQPHHP